MATYNILKKKIIKKYYINELKKRKWIKFKDETDELQICIDLLDFLKIKDFEVVPKLEEQVLFKKQEMILIRLHYGLPVVMK